MAWKLVWIFVVSAAIFQPDVARGQQRIERAWDWIEPLVTTRTEVEKRFGQSISKDKSHPFQTYEAEFFKVNIAYAKGTEKPLGARACLASGTVISVYVSPLDLPLSALDVDIKAFRKDLTYFPREVSYFDELNRTLLTTTLIETDTNELREMVVAIRYQPRVQLIDTGRSRGRNPGANCGTCWGKQRSNQLFDEHGTPHYLL